MNKKEGFTLIELLVVIAIIGILSSVVLASLNTARGKGANASVKANLSGLRAAAELWYDNNSSVYTGFCGATGATPALVAADAAGGGATSLAAGAYKCFADSDSWVATAGLKVLDGTTGTTFCVDSTGKATVNTTALAYTAITTANTMCP